MASVKRWQAGEDRRSPGEHSVYRSKDGSGWVAVLELSPDPGTGKRRRKRFMAPTRKAAVAKLEAYEQEMRGLRPSGSITLGAFLNEWVDTVVAGRVDSANALANVRQVVRLHLIPALGALRLDELTAEHVDVLLRHKATRGKLDALPKARQERLRRSGKPLGLARTYVARIRSTLIDALRHAERRGYVGRNVAELSVMPKTRERTPRVALTVEQERALLEACDGYRSRDGSWRPERLRALVVVGLTVGLRPGELTGVLWPDVQLDTEPPTLSVTGATKQVPKDGGGYRLERGKVKKATAAQRTIALPPFAVDALRRHLELQGEERSRAADMWEEHGLVFSNELGGALDPANVRRTVKRIMERAGIDGAGFTYALRHASVSHLIDSGATIEQVADVTGDSPRTVLDHYRHRVRPVADGALGRWDVLAVQRGPLDGPLEATGG